MGNGIGTRGTRARMRKGIGEWDRNENVDRGTDNGMGTRTRMRKGNGKRDENENEEGVRETGNRMGTRKE